MRGRARVTRFEGAVLADCLYLVGRAWVRLRTGDQAGADEDLSAAMKLVPPDTVRAIMGLIEAGGLPEPGLEPGSVDAWLEACRRAGAGEWALIRIMFPSASELAEEEREAFLQRLDEIAADAERRMASGELKDRPPPPKKPVRETKRELDEPGALSESLRRMGLM